MLLIDGISQFGLLPNENQFFGLLPKGESEYQWKFFLWIGFYPNHTLMKLIAN